MSPAEVELESRTGKVHVEHRDKYGRPVLVMDASKENTKSHEASAEPSPLCRPRVQTR